jgi:hypothetical protein
MDLSCARMGCLAGAWRRVACQNGEGNVWIAGIEGRKQATITAQARRYADLLALPVAYRDR